MIIVEELRQELGLTQNEIWYLIDDFGMDVYTDDAKHIEYIGVNDGNRLRNLG